MIIRTANATSTMMTTVHFPPPLLSGPGDRLPISEVLVWFVTLMLTFVSAVSLSVASAVSLAVVGFGVGASVAGVGANVGVCGQLGRGLS